MVGPLAKAGRYQIVEELGRGSMGVVYRGYDPVIGRTVAIKTILTEGLNPQEFEEYKYRFQREARAAGSLTHPNIVTVYDFGEDNNVLYLAMEFLEGKSLANVVGERGVLPIETILPIYDQVCSALDHAHAHKIVHRDIKPANIMILHTGLVKVTDFGIAKVATMGMTQAGQILGTPKYMSPEQVKGRSVDGRSDIFSLGVILYELVTGEKPFAGQNITTVIYKIINENPRPPCELDAPIDAGLSYVISRALAKNPDERYQTCRELADDLRNYRNLGGLTAPADTVMVRVPPAQPSRLESVSLQAPPPLLELEVPSPPARESLVGEAILEPRVRPSPGQATPRIQPVRQGSNTAFWVVAILLLGISIGAVGRSLYVGYGPGKKIASEIQPAMTQPGSQGTPSSSASSGAAPGGTATGGLQTPAVTPAPKTPEGQTQGGESPSGQGTSPKVETVRSVETLPTPRGVGKAAPGPKIAQLLVTSNLPGAQISIDGARDPAWVTPYTFKDLPAGTHTVVVSMQGYDDAAESVTLEGGRTNTFQALLVIPMGELDIETTPRGAEVLIDGKSYGPSPVRATLAAGEHTYTIKVPGRDPYERTMTLKSGALINKRVELNLTGIVVVRSIPSGASVLVDGTPYGGPTPTSFRLPEGRHTLVVSLSGYRTVTQEVEVTSVNTSEVNVTFSNE